MNTRESVRTDPRMAGAVRRYHTWPTIQTQTVAEASWNVARILLTVWPESPGQAISHALLNDCGELASGDLPFPIKKNNPVLKSEITRIEMESMMEQGILCLAAAPADDIWRRRVKLCDMLEMWEFGLVEVHMGNSYGRPIVSATLDDVRRLYTEFELKAADVDRVEEYVRWRLEK